MYIENTDLLVTGNEQDNTQSLTQKVQKMADKWWLSLWISDGCLRPDKFWWYMIRFIWRAEGTCRWTNIDKTPADIWVPDENRTLQRIKQHNPDVRKMTLGTILAPDIKNANQLKWMNKETDGWTRNINRSCMLKFSADISVRTTIIKTLAYPTASIIILEKDCYKLMAKKKRCTSKNGLELQSWTHILIRSNSLPGYGVPDFFYQTLSWAY